MRWLAAMLAVVALVVVACAGDDGVQPPADAVVMTTADDVSLAEEDLVEPPTEAADEVFVWADLTAGAAVPGPGDEDATGLFEGIVRALELGGELCYDLEVADTSSQVVAAHVHAGRADEPGRVVVRLLTPASRPVTGCVELGSMDLDLLLTDPTAFYVNVHTVDHPDGAVRGQLEIVS